MLIPILSELGQGLLFVADKDQGRRHLLELFFMQDEEKRMPAHNWYVLSQAPPRTNTQHGEKVARLSVPLYPFDEAFHDLKEQNAKILNVVQGEQLKGGAPKRNQEKLKELFYMESQTLLGGAAPLQVVDKDGNLQPFFVNVQEIEDALVGVAQACNSTDEQLLGMVRQLQDDLKKVKEQCLNKTKGTMAIPVWNSAPTKPVQVKKANRPSFRTASGPYYGQNNGRFPAPRQQQSGRWGGSAEEAPKNE